MKHDYHFVLTNELKEKIVLFANEKSMKLSETVVYILNFMKPLLEKHYFKNVICKSGKYNCFTADNDMHVYFDEKDYRYLKQVHSNLYCYSMAIVLRWILNEFFNGIKAYGFDRFCDVVGRFGCVFLGVRQKNIKNNCLFYKNTQHLFASVQNYNRIYHIFDKEYNLIATKFT